MDFNSEKTLNAKIGGYKLPADFKCLNINYLKELENLSFTDRLRSIYNRVLGKNLSDSAFENLSKAQFPASVYGVDEGVSILELFDGNNCSYTDYFLNGETVIDKAVLLSFTIVSSYVDLCSSERVEYGQKINVASACSDGVILLALHFCKLIKLPIETIILGVDKPIDCVLKGVYFNLLEKGEVEEITSAFFEETDYLIDPVSANGLIAYDFYYDDYEDELETLVLALNSPYLFSRSVLKTITGINELSVDKAISKLSEFTAIDIPDVISSGEIQPFYRQINEISVKDALEIIKG